jgi:Abnormal spindle-like microcephaly-assoc'd, ASPM-SPD-2-Hydin/Transmembrane protein 131-like N-terminal
MLSPCRIEGLLACISLAAVILSSTQVVASPADASPSQASRAISGSLWFEPAILHFGNAVLGQAYVQPVTLVNPGRSTLVISDIYRSNPNFKLRGLKLPLRLAPGEHVSFEIAFIPTRSEDADVDFTFGNDRSTNVVLHADGTGVSSGLISTPARVDFGDVREGNRERLPITLANSGSATQTVVGVAVSGNEFGFWGIHLPLTLAPGESLTFNATFAPARAGASAGKIILDTGGSSLSIPFHGQGSEVGQLGIAPTHLSFGNVSVGSAATLTGKLFSGANDVTIYSAGITSPEFALAGISFPLTIPAGHSKSYEITFTPNSSGETFAVVRFHSSSVHLPDEQALVGNGVPRSSHSVNLSWNPETSGVVGYNVYRSSSPSGPYSRINAATDPNNFFLDTTVEGGQTYFYATTAIASNGKQSAFSNSVQVVIP